jgi:hypothetical protein
MQMILMHLPIHSLAFLVVQDKPYNKDDDVIKATSFEVISTLRDVLKTSSLWRDHVQTYTQVSSLSRFSVKSLFCANFAVIVLLDSRNACFYLNTLQFLHKGAFLQLHWFIISYIYYYVIIL